MKQFKVMFYVSKNKMFYSTVKKNVDKGTRKNFPLVNFKRKVRKTQKTETERQRL